MPTIDPYIFFDGNCAEAMRAYETILGGKLEALMTHAETLPPDQIAPGMADRIMHASLLFEGDRRLMASDDMVGTPYGGMKGFAISVAYPAIEEGQRVFDALADGGNVAMPYAETFWVERFGMVTDRYGTPWMISGGASKMR